MTTSTMGPTTPGAVGAGIPPRSDLFEPRHTGPSDQELLDMLGAIGASSMDDLIRNTVPASILLTRDLDLPRAMGEHEALATLRTIASKNKVFRSCLGMGYAGTLTPTVILRNILENPGWYTQYTPYQAEISQGRLEALLNFQTMVSDLTGLPVSNASLLDEGTAAAEAMAMCHAIDDKRPAFFVSADCHPQTIAVVRTRGASMGVEIEVGDEFAADLASKKYAGVLVQYPTTDGRIRSYHDLARSAHESGTLVVAASDLLALTLIEPPGEWGADICVGSAQRFGVPMGFGGPHAAFLATRDEFVRKMPGRIIGVSKDSAGNPALRMAIQTREQHIKRDRATSNICTAQALLAIMASMYAVYHGPDGLRNIAERTRAFTTALAEGLEQLGHTVFAGDPDAVFFDTLRVTPGSGSASEILGHARDRRINLRAFADGTIGISLDETTDEALVHDLLACFGQSGPPAIESLAKASARPLGRFARTSAYLTHPIFNTHDSETELLRYIFQLQSRDLSLAHSMISLGSCTMKLNATSEMIPVTWPEFGQIHPFSPPEQTQGYFELFRTLEDWLAEITGFAAVSLQPNAGSQGEYAGLLAIRAYHESRGHSHRNICLIPTSAHGTNPASAVIAGFEVVPVKCDQTGAIDADDLRTQAEKHAENLGALMVTYPSTFGVFDQNIEEICAIVHKHGGQVYLDGANMNAQVGLCRPGDYGADVCHLNLHKTFCIPHGGGGPGIGPIGVAPHLVPFLPGHPVVSPQSHRAGEASEPAGVGAVAAAPWGSASILVISWMYIAMMGPKGLRKASEAAILNANYMAHRLDGHYEVLYRGKTGRVAHEFIVDCRGFDKTAGIKIDDIAKRLMDYGFHAPTMSWPVPGTLMIEPTESEPMHELDRFCDAMISIRAEIRAIEEGKADREDNVLRNSPHTIEAVASNDWSHPYSREEAGFPKPWLRRNKLWPSVGRIDNPFGDRNLVCTCPPMESYSGE
ncbi:MAG: aminomethyl-transferring glycine dehydrogenase [Phycisphaerales bacterium JB037]